MEFNKQLVKALIGIFSVTVERFNSNGAKLHKRSAFLGYAVVKVGLRVGEKIVPLFHMAQIQCKILPNAGQSIEFPSEVWKSNAEKRTPFYRADSAEMRALLTWALFRDERVSAVAEEYEAKLDARESNEEEVDSTDLAAALSASLSEATENLADGEEVNPYAGDDIPF